MALELFGTLSTQTDNSTNGNVIEVDDDKTSYSHHNPLSTENFDFYNNDVIKDLGNF